MLNVQTRRHMHQEMHPQQLPRRRIEQGRVRLPGSMCCKVLRSEHQSLGEDAGRSEPKTGRWNAEIGESWNRRELVANVGKSIALMAHGDCRAWQSRAEHSAWTCAEKEAINARSALAVSRPKVELSCTKGVSSMAQRRSRSCGAAMLRHSVHI